MVNYWIFVIGGGQIDVSTEEGRKELQLFLSAGFWKLGEKTHHKQNLLKGDKVVFYLAGKGAHCFVADATIAGPAYKLSKEEYSQRMSNNLSFDSPFGVLIENALVWNVPLLAKKVLQQLQFVRVKSSFGAYLVNGVRKLTKTDFDVILGAKQL